MPKYTFLLLEKAPHLSNEWHPKNNLDFNKAHAYSVKKVWWVGKCGHEWHAAIGSRTQGAGCPYCGGFLPTDKNRFSILCPEFLAEWDYDKNVLSPGDVTKFSSKRVWWLCKNKHSWKTKIADRVINNSKCPYCIGKLVCETNCLAVVSPTIAKEWHYEKNKPLTPYQVLPKIHKEVWWICGKCGNEWIANINNRNKKTKPTGCPACAAMHFKKQKLLCDQVKLILPETKISYNYRHPGLRYRNTNAKMQLDIFIPKLNVAIEYQGEYHFLPIISQEVLVKRQEMDQEKREACAKYCIKLFEIDYTWNGDFRVVDNLLKEYVG